MSISKMILPEFEHEMASTRKTLERVPDDKFSWKPHEKSMTLGGLATHLSNIPSWTAMTFDRDELDIAPPGEPYRLEEAKSRSCSKLSTRTSLLHALRSRRQLMRIGRASGLC